MSIKDQAIEIIEGFEKEGDVLQVVDLIGQLLFYANNWSADMEVAADLVDNTFSHEDFLHQLEPCIEDLVWTDKIKYLGETLAKVQTGMSTAYYGENVQELAG